MIKLNGIEYSEETLINNVNCDRGFFTCEMIRREMVRLEKDERPIPAYIEDSFLGRTYLAKNPARRACKNIYEYVRKMDKYHERQDKLEAIDKEIVDKYIAKHDIIT